jgi:hypothetical protein
MKNRFQRQRLIEDRVDIVVAGALLAALFLGLLLLPKAVFWYWMIPLGLFWVRWNYVRVRRDQRSLDAEIAADGWSSAAPDNGSQCRIGPPH